MTDTDTVTADSATDALTQRLQAVAGVLLPDLVVADRPAARSGRAAALLAALATTLAGNADPAAVWLTLTAVAGAFPEPEDVRYACRECELADAERAAAVLLEVGGARALAVGSPAASIKVIQGGILVDVHQSARSRLHTGIQQVVRHLLPRWLDRPEMVLACWTARRGGYRRLTDVEFGRAANWDGRPREAATDELTVDPAEPELLVPWRSIVVLPEVPPDGTARALAAIGAMSGSTITAVGYDMIPLISAETVPLIETERFAGYLSAMKYARRIATISRTAAVEFAGWASMLAAQGLAGPDVLAVPLPDAIDDQSPEDPIDAGHPSVLVVGSHEPRKNHLAVLHAAEVLWREGLSFQLDFIGGSGFGDEFPRRVTELVRAGRPVTVRRAVDRTELLAAYRAARFTVFPSLHEGYGLPVAESLSHHTPVITSEYGSTAEIAADGGVVVLDPRDDDALVDRMRTLLRDDVALATLRAQIANRPRRGWDRYAAELWDALVADVRA